MSTFINDLANNYVGGISLKPKTYTTTSNGEPVDLSSGDGQAFAVVVSGLYTDGTHVITLQESKNAGAADEHSAADTFAAIADTVTINNISDAAIQIVTFRHSEPWVRAVTTISGSPGTGAVYAVLVMAPKKSV